MFEYSIDLGGIDDDFRGSSENGFEDVEDNPDTCLVSMEKPAVEPSSTRKRIVEVRSSCL